MLAKIRDGLKIKRRIGNKVTFMILKHLMHTEGGEAILEFDMSVSQMCDLKKLPKTIIGNKPDSTLNLAQLLKETISDIKQEFDILDLDAKGVFKTAKFTKVIEHAIAEIEKLDLNVFKWVNIKYVTVPGKEPHFLLEEKVHVEDQKGQMCISFRYEKVTTTKLQKKEIVKVVNSLLKRASLLEVCATSAGFDSSVHYMLRSSGSKAEILCSN